MKNPNSHALFLSSSSPEEQVVTAPRSRLRLSRHTNAPRHHDLPPFSAARQIPVPYPCQRPTNLDSYLVLFISVTKGGQYQKKCSKQNVAGGVYSSHVHEHARASKKPARPVLRSPPPRLRLRSRLPYQYSVPQCACPLALRELPTTRPRRRRRRRTATAYFPRRPALTFERLFSEFLSLGRTDDHRFTVTTFPVRALSALTCKYQSHRTFDSKLKRPE